MKKTSALGKVESIAPTTAGLFYTVNGIPYAEVELEKDNHNPIKKFSTNGSI